MKKKLFNSTVFALALTTTALAQHNAGCGVYQAQEHYISTIPGYKEKLEAVRASVAGDFQTYLHKKATQKTASLVTYTIPVVFHILHTNGPENVADADCISALNQVNQDYARASGDTITIDPLYEPLYVNSRIKFVLAKKDPQGNCTTGIVHHYDENTEWKQSDIYNYIYSTVGSNTWRSSKYLNIYVVKNIIKGSNATTGTVLGYTHLPGTAPNIGSDAIVYRYDNLVGLLARSLSHEIGHWLGLSHTFGSTNNPGITCGDDDIGDTPRTSGFFTICPPLAQRSDSCSPGRRPNVENIMDYSSCPKMFTQGQTDKMRFSLESSIAERNNLWSEANLMATGILNNTVTACAPIADFSSNKVTTCSGQSVVFNSTSYNGTVSNYSWVFEGGTPATSTSSAPTVTYSTPGVYSVSLTVSNALGSSKKVGEAYMRASWNADPASIPYVVSFDDGNFPAGWYIQNEDYNTDTWQWASYGSQNSSKSLMLDVMTGNFRNGDIDILETRAFNFKNISNISISFDYSTARKPGEPLGNQSSLKLEYSTDCGGTWFNIPGGVPTDAVLASTGGTLTGAYVPNSASKWATRSYSSILLGSTFNNKSNVKFRFWYQNNSASSQNMYIDNFNISGVVGVNELENTIGLLIYPNPTTSSSVVEFTSPVDSKVMLSVYDVTGRLVEGRSLKADAGINTKYVVNEQQTLNSGVYFVTLDLNNQKVTKKLIVQ